MPKHFTVVKYMDDWRFQIYFENIIKIEPFTDEKGGHHTRFYIIGEDCFESVDTFNSPEYLGVDECEEFIKQDDGSFISRQHADMVPYL